jgi:hypothetical protein
MLLAIIISLVLVFATVHYEGLRLVSHRLQRSIAIQRRSNVLLNIFGILLIHIIEISL